MTRFTDWLATSPVASLLKIVLPQVLVLVTDNAAELGISPAVSVIIGAALTIAVNALNPSDPRYGKLADEWTDQD